LFLFTPFNDKNCRSDIQKTQIRYLFFNENKDGKSTEKIKIEKLKKRIFSEKECQEKYINL